MIDSILKKVKDGLFVETFEIPFEVEGVIIIPGFVDTHAHLAEHGFFMRYPSLSGINSKKELLEFVKENLDIEKEINLFVDYDDSFFMDGKIYKEDLDRISKDTPIVLRRVCGHVAILNTKAIEYFVKKIGEEYIDVQNGIAYEYLPLNLYDILDPALDEVKEGIQLAEKKYLDDGITGVCDFAKDFKIFLAYRELDEKNKLKIKIELSFYESSFSNLKEMGLYTGKTFGRLKIGGIKMFMDGSVGGRTASFYNPYKDAPPVSPFYSEEKLREKIKKYEMSGFKVLIHAIGTRAIDTVVSAMPNIPDFNHRIEHFEFPSPYSLKGVREKKLHISMQPNFIRRWHKMYKEAISLEEFSKMHPYKTMQDMDISYGFGSDSMPQGPLYGINGAISHPFISERLEKTDAFRYYTEYAQRIATLPTGAFKKGFFADFVVIQENKVKSVYVEGKRIK